MQGYNAYGTVGDNTTTTPRVLPTPVVTAAGGATWQTIPHRIITSGTSLPAHMCGILSDASLACWGYGGNGQLGLGTTNNAKLPTAINTTTSSSSWYAVSVGYLFTCAISIDWRMYCWGYNAAGQLGDATTVAQRLLPVEVYAGGYWIQLSSGLDATCGVRSDKSLRCAWQQIRTGVGWTGK